MIKNYILEDETPVLEIDIIKWGKWFQAADRHVAKTELDDYTISTVFLGLDYSFGGSVPILFESMVFKKGTFNDEDCERYETMEQARKGHYDLVKKWA